jgi:hypothetical protein
MKAGLLLAEVLLSGAAAPADDFRHGLAHWQIEDEGGATVRAADAVLDIDAPHGISLWWRERLTGPVAIDYDVEPVAAGGPQDAVSDVNAFWMATDPSAPGGSPLAHPRSGAFASYDTLLTYYVGIGGNRNTTTRFRRYIGQPGNRPLLPQHDRSDPAAMLQPNRWTHVGLIANGRRIAVERDGKPLFTYDDPQAYRSGWFALRTTKSHLRIRNLRITRL